LFSYKLGFIRRALVGSIVTLMSGDFVSKDFVWIFVFCSYILLFLLAAYLLGQVIKSANDNLKLFAIGLVILYLASPISIASLFTMLYSYEGDIVNAASRYYYIDLYTMLFFLVIILLLNLKRSYKLQWLIPVFCFMMMATHPVAIFIYVPTIFILLLYNIYENNKSKRSIILFIVSTLVMVFFSIYFSFFATPNFQYSTIEEVISRFPNSDFLSKDDWFLNADFMAVDIKSHMVSDGYENFNIFKHLVPRFLASSLLMFPLIIIGIKLWAGAIRNEKNKILRYLFLLSAFSSICYIFSIIVPDWGRWITLAFSSQFALFFHYFHAKEKSVLFTAEKSLEFFKRNPFLYFILISYLFILGRVFVFLTLELPTNLKAILSYFIH
jgi:hypothetical protein